MGKLSSVALLLPVLVLACQRRPLELFLMVPDDLAESYVFWPHIRNPSQGSPLLEPPYSLFLPLTPARQAKHLHLAQHAASLSLGF